MSKKNNYLLPFILVIFSYLSTTAQTTKIPKDSRVLGNSPYSVFGLGEILPTSGIGNEAMGGTGLTFANGIYVNTSNPAMVVKNRYLAFSAGLRGNVKKLSDGTNTQQDFGMNLSHVAFAFPIRPKWSMSVGLRPYTIVDHDARYVKTIAGSTNNVQYSYKGVGGTSRASYANSFQIGKSLFVGAELNYNFGSFTRDTTSRLMMGDGSDYYLRYSTRTAPTGLSYRTGLVWQQKLSKKWNMNIGGTYEAQSKLNAQQLRTFATYVDFGAGQRLLTSPDTLSLRESNYTIPAKYAVGISFESPYKWVIAAEYALQDWTAYKDFGGVGSKYFTKAETMSFGVESLPAATSTKFLSQSFYRIGFKQTKMPYLINGTQIQDRSFTFGWSFPLAYRSASYIDLGFAAGQRGNIGNGLVKENYFTMSVGFSFIDARWFSKPKID